MSYAEDDGGGGDGGEMKNLNTHPGNSPTADPLE